MDPARASVVAQAIARGWLERRIIPIVDFDRGYNDMFSWSMSRGLQNSVSIDVAMRRYLFDLATGRLGMLGTRLNASTVRLLVRRGMIKFASYMRVSDTRWHVNYAWLRHDVPVGTDLPRPFTELHHGSVDNKRVRGVQQPAFVAGDVLSVIAGFLPLGDWASLSRLCSSSRFDAPRSALRKQVADRMGCAPRDPIASLRTYSAARSGTSWRCTRTTVFSWDRRWATSHRHGCNDRILRMWPSGDSRVHFITSHGMCATLIDGKDPVVRVSKMSPMSLAGGNFRVLHFALGADGCICLVHTGGLSTYSNAVSNRVMHVAYDTRNTRELACVSEMCIYVTYGSSRRLYTVCRSCADPHMRPVYIRAPPVVQGCARGCANLASTANGVVWRSGHLRLWRGSGARAVPILPGLHGRGRVVYISDKLPTGVNAVLRANGDRVTTIAFTDGVSMLRTVDLLRAGVVVRPMRTHPFTTAGDMLMFRDRETRRVCSIRPETDPLAPPRPIAFAMTLGTGRRITRHDTCRVFFAHGAVYVVQGGCTIHRYMADVS